MVQQFSKSIKITISLFRPLTLDIPERFGPCLFIMLTASLRILNCCISIASEIFFIDKFRNILRNDAIKSDFSEHCICKLFPEGFGSGQLHCHDSNNESCSPRHGINHANYMEVHPVASYFLLIDLVDKGA